MSVLILNREQIQEVIDMREVLEKVRGVYQLKSKGESVIWPLVTTNSKKKMPPWIYVPATLWETNSFTGLKCSITSLPTPTKDCLLSMGL